MVSEVFSLLSPLRLRHGARQTQGDGSTHRVSIHRDTTGVDHWWQDGAATMGGPFRSRTWLDAFFATFVDRDDIEPFFVDVRDENGAFVIGLPLIRREIGKRSFIEFADLGVADYNLPILGPAAPSDGASATELLAAIRRALPAADVLRLGKMPLTIAGRANPLTLVDAIVPETLFGNTIETGDTWDAWLHTLGGRDRREFARSWRNFTRHPDARLVIAEDADTARRILHWIEHRQRARILEQGLDYDLDAPQMSTFHERLIDQGLESGEVVVSALMAGDEIVAGLFGLANGEEYIALRVAFEAGRWTSIGPGRLLLERTMAAFHDRGYRRFDLGIGDYTYKRDFRPVTCDLGLLVAPLSLAGYVEVVRTRAHAHLRTIPALVSIVRHVRNRRNPFRTITMGCSTWYLAEEIAVAVTIPYL